MDITVNNLQELEVFGSRIGSCLRGGEVIELIGDVGAGKTALVKTIARGAGVAEDVGSPSYTLSQIYETPNGLRLAHYDFYRLDDAGILANDLEEVVADQSTVTLIEWSAVVANVLPEDHMQIKISPISENARLMQLTADGLKSQTLLECLNDSVA